VMAVRLLRRIIVGHSSHQPARPRLTLILSVNRAPGHTSIAQS